MKKFYKKLPGDAFRFLVEKFRFGRQSLRSSILELVYCDLYWHLVAGYPRHRHLLNKKDFFKCSKKNTKVTDHKKFDIS